MAEEALYKMEQLHSMVDSLKEITTIIIGLALTNSIIQFLLVEGRVKEVKEISLISSVIFVLLIVNMIRFYHGNFRHLDVTYSPSSLTNSVSGSIKQHPKGEKVTIDFFCILLESLILCAMSFYQTKPLYFFSIFVALMVVDIFWFFVTFHFVPNKELFEHQKAWAMNNLGAIIVLLIICAFWASFQQEILIYLSAAALFINTIRDYRVNWDLYFPLYAGEEKKGGRNK